MLGRRQQRHGDAAPPEIWDAPLIWNLVAKTRENEYNIYNGRDRSEVAFLKQSEAYVQILRRRRWTLISLLVIVPLGFYTKFYAGPAAAWVNNSLSGVLYVIFWCLLAFLLVPDARPWGIAWLVLIITCTLEVAQLWHPPALEWLRGSFIGRTLLGTHFAWSDFAYYVLGSGIGFLWLRWLQRTP